jgi:hypothetical protein
MSPIPELDANQTPDKQIIIYLPIKIPDKNGSLTNASSAATALALIHEVAHAQQNPNLPAKDRETQAFTTQIQFLINDPALRSQLSDEEKAYYNKFITMRGNKEVPNERAIGSYVDIVYQKFHGTEKTALERVKKNNDGQESYEFGDPQCKSQLKTWK